MIEVPFLNPLRYKKQGYQSKFNTKFFDEHQYVDTLLPEEEKAEYSQPWAFNDTIFQQIHSDEDQVILEVYDSNGLVFTEAFAFISSLPNGVKTFHHSFLVNTLGVGDYYAVLKAGPFRLESNQFTVLTQQPGTVRWDYFHNKQYGDVIFQLGAKFQLRVQGYIRHNKPNRVSTTYINQREDAVQQKTTTYNSYTFITNAAGIPTYMIDLVNMLMGCSTLKGDGRNFVIPGDANWEAKEQDLYPMRGWGIDLREAFVKSSLALRATYLGKQSSGKLLTQSGGGLIV